MVKYQKLTVNTNSEKVMQNYQKVFLPQLHQISNVHHHKLYYRPGHMTMS